MTVRSLSGNKDEERDTVSRRRIRRTSLIALAVVFVIVAVVVVAIGPWRHASSDGPNASPDTPGASDSPARNPTSSAAVIFSDDFGQHDLSSEWQPVAGTWTVADGELSGSPPAYPRSAIIILNRDLQSDIIVRFRTKLLDKGDAELMLHVSDDRFVRVHLVGASQSVGIGDGGLVANRQIAAGSEVLHKTYSVEAGVWYDITVTVQGEQYAVAVGGSTVAFYNDTEGALSRSGRLGFAVRSAGTRFDDLTVQSP